MIEQAQNKASLRQEPLLGNPPRGRKPRLGYLLAASHSGSTLLAMLLGAHPEACTVGELKFTNLGDPDRYRCSCGEFIRRCEFWRKVTAGMKNRGIDFAITEAGTSIHGCGSPYVNRLLRPLHRGPVLEAVRDLALSLSPAWHAHLRETQARNTALMEILTEMTGAKVIIDSSKIALRLKYLLRNPNLDVQIIRLVRDGRGVALTYMDDWNFADASEPSLRGGGVGKSRDRRNRSMAEAAYEWRRSNEAADCVIERLNPASRVTVRYEDLCADPWATLESLCEFLQLPPGAIVRDFRSIEHHVIGNGMRLDKTSDIRLDERWRNHLSAGDLREFDRVAGQLNRKYGYA